MADVASLSPTVVGALAGTGTAICFAFTAYFFGAAGKRLGVLVVNSVRLALAISLLLLTHRLLLGSWWPGALELRQVVFLAASGFVGLAVGDQALFTAFVVLGPRLSTLIMTTAPIFAALLGALFLEEALGPRQWFGIAITVSGVAWVVGERGGESRGVRDAGRGRGVLLAFIGAMCQAGGILLGKQGMGHGWLADDARLDPLAATLVRMVFAGATILPILAWRLRGRRRRPAPARIGTRSGGYLFTAAGALVGPYCGVWLSLVASDRVPIGIAQTLISLTPLFVLPIAIFWDGERVSARAALGSCVAVMGLALIFTG